MNLYLHLLLIFIICNIQTKPTQFTYIVKHQLNQDDQYIQIQLDVLSESRSLKQAIKNAQKIIRNTEKIVQNDCENHAKSKQQIKQCQNLVQTNKYIVQPKYHIVRRIPTFTLFIVSHQVVVKIKNTQNLGKITDKIIRQGYGLITIKNFKWKAQEQKDPQRQAIKQGLKQGKQLCTKINKKYIQIVKIQQLEEPVVQQKQQQDEDSIEEQTQNTIFRFTILCQQFKTSKNKQK